MPTVIKCPCKECPDKGCGAYHCKCEKYLAYVEALEKLRKIRASYLATMTPGPLLEKNLRRKLLQTKR